MTDQGAVRFCLVPVVGGSEMPGDDLPIPASGLPFGESMVLAGIAGIDPRTTAVHPYLVLDEASREPAPTEGGVLEGGTPRRSCAALFGRAATKGPWDAGEDAAMTDASADCAAPSTGDSSVLDAPGANEGELPWQMPEARFQGCSRFR